MFEGHTFWFAGYVSRALNISWSSCNFCFRNSSSFVAIGARHNLDAYKPKICKIRSPTFCCIWNTDTQTLNHRNIHKLMCIRWHRYIPTPHTSEAHRISLHFMTYIIMFSSNNSNKDNHIWLNFSSTLWQLFSLQVVCSNLSRHWLCVVPLVYILPQCVVKQPL